MGRTEDRAWRRRFGDAGRAWTSLARVGGAVGGGLAALAALGVLGAADGGRLAAGADGGVAGADGCIAGVYGGVAGAAAGAHPFRLSVVDAEVDGDMLRARIRFFWDDLQLALMEHRSDMAFRLEETPRVDSIVVAYIGEMLAIEAGGRRLAGVLDGRGVDDAVLIDEVMWWYRLEYRLPAGTARIAIRNRLLFNMFEDQRNVVHLKTRSGRERAFAFGWDKDSAVAALN